MSGKRKRASGERGSWRLFRQTYKDRSGKTQEAAAWYAGIRLGDGEKRLPLFPDRAASEETARKIAKLAAARAAGEAPDLALTKWLETIPTALRDRLAALGLLDKRRVAAGTPLAQHVTDYEADLLADGNTPKHAADMAGKVRRVFEGCEFRAWSDLSASKVLKFLASLREDTQEGGEFVKRGISARTSNGYLGAVKAFAKWMVKDGRASESPVAHLDALNTRTDRRHCRRALPVDQLRRLLEHTERAGSAFGMSGPERAMAYRLALETGLRASELRSLTRASFTLSGAGPTVTVHACYSKRRRTDTLPLRPRLAADLAEFFGPRMPAVRAFNLPASTHTAAMLRADLDAAREAWIAEGRTDEERAERRASDFLAYTDAAGRVFDFHALRHQFISSLATGGVHPKVAQTLARHSTITLTMDHYTHTLAGDEAAALAALPDLGTRPNTRRATGTDGARP